MRFITGGAFNGKRAWVKKNYPEAEWISAYKGEPLVENFGVLQSSAVVLEGIELWTKELSAKMTINQAREYWRKVLEDWLEWENLASNRKIIVIGTDITKGIVPMEKENRNWRDLTGWVYQDLSFRCERVDVIWYGINQTIKG
ncbi:bifunctional adenosylcobinamide kinase/adenosylcobinamide-phosphate guanylyltransferase [Oceanobacillus salinisoli]|uniref:bifunctional adenosylcobinamide kinase/adenosylcobinamide-phosphate guanylyltransferase n=1 Tax=Oceanobacillus salinisoli TaxID=2678611 RepID=UPI0012E21DBB|nr:bifunctional adenosylcobinamide kinase/adenosylcobinamide-phosphate guanylyltransferase [Oceanobacillus salinisoli]